MHILIIHPKDNNSEMLHFNYQSSLACSIEWVETYPKAMEHMLDDYDINLLLCFDSPETVTLLKYLSSLDAKIPYILIGQDSKANTGVFPEIVNIGVLESIYDMESLKTLINQAKEKKVITDTVATNEYRKINTALLLKVIPLEADIYIRLSSIKFVKMFRKGRDFTQDDADKFLNKKKVRYLYVKKDEMEGFAVNFRNKLSNLVKSGNLKQEEKVTVAVSVHEAIAELMPELGFSSEVREIAREGVQLTMESIGQSPKLSKLFEMIESEMGSYYSSHAIATAHTACALATKLKWPSETTFKKLTLAAFFHDICVENKKLTEFDGLNDLQEKKMDLDDAELKNYKSHPYLASDILKGFPDVPPDVDTIIMQHHERPDGSGFPRGMLAHNISPLAALFIVSHDYVRFLFEKRFDSGLNGFKKRFGYTDQCTKGTFRKALAAIEF